MGTLPTEKFQSLADTEIMMIGPKEATAWLENNKFSNRHVNDRTVDKITRDIKENKWVYDGNAIKFDKEGNIIDGQHRLWAIIKSQKIVRALVVRHLSECAVNVIDTGKPRTNPDVLHFNGFTNTNVLANACRISLGYKITEGDLGAWARNKSGDKISSSEMVKEASNNKKLIDAIASIGSQKFMKKFMGAGTAAFCYHLFSKKDKLHADEFFYLLENGNNLDDGHAVLALRNSLTLRDHISSKMIKGGNYRTAYIIALVIKAWNAYRTQRHIKRVTWSMDRESYPVPE